MALDTNSILILVTLFLVHGIFLCFDLFRRGQNYGYFAYITAIIPINFLWYLASVTDTAGLDVLTVYLVLFLLWSVNLFRDFFLEVKEQRNHIATLLFLGIGILVHFVLTAILPELNVEMQENCQAFWYFWLPQVYTDGFGIASWVNTSILLGYRISATLLVLLALVPLIVYLKNSGEQSFLDLVIVTAIFILPFIFLSYVWLAQALWVLTFLFSVILLIVLLLLTKNKRT